MKEENERGKKKEFKKKSRPNNEKFYIYNLTWKRFKKPLPFALRRTNYNNHTSERNPSVDAAPRGEQRKEKRPTDTRKGQGRARPNQQDKHKPWETDIWSEDL